MGALNKNRYRETFRGVVVGLALAMAFIGVLFLAGCATTPPPAASWCDVNYPQRPSQETLAAMSDEEVTEALSHNLYGQQNCGWRPSE